MSGSFSKVLCLAFAIVSIFSACSGTVMAATQEQRDDVLKNSPLHDGVELAGCSIASGVSEASSKLTDSVPGQVYLLGDSLSDGVKGPLANELTTGDGWSIKSDTRVSRPLSEGITIAKGAPADLKSAKYIVIILGTNPDPKNNTAGIVEMIGALRATNPSAPIYWQNVNVTNSKLTAGAKTFNDALRATSGITMIDNTVAPGDDGTHPSDYGALAKIVATAVKSTKSATNIANLTEDQKIASTFIVGFSDAATMEAAVKKFHLGGVYILGTQDAASAGFTKDFFAKLKSSVGGSLITSSDEEGTAIHRYKYSFDFPNAHDMAAKSDAEVEALGKQVGDALAANGINTDLAPVLDVSVDAGGTDAGTAGRAFSNDPAVVAAKAGAFAKGLKSAGVNSVYKHFPGLGSTPGNTDTGVQTSPNISTLKGKDLKPYESLLGQNGSAVMLNNASIPGLTEAGNVASTSPAAVKLLKNDYKFNGLVTTDDLKAVGVGQPLPAAIVKSLQAGVDAPLFTYTSDADIQAAIDAAKAAKISVDSNLTKIMSFNGVASDINSMPSCCAVATSTTLVGSDNGEKTWNFLIGKGLSNVQAAGIMGNLQQESNFNPTIANPTSGAFGIVQWLPKSKLDNHQKEAGIGGDPNELATQLDVMWWEASNKGKSPTGYGQVIIDKVKELNDVKAVRIFWHQYFEGSLGQDDAKRDAFALAWLNKASGGAGSGSESTSVDPASAGCTGTGNAATGSGDISAYSSPFHSPAGLGQSRIDRGVDYYAPTDDESIPIYAIGNGEVTVATDKSTFFTTSHGHSDWITYKLTDGPAAGKYIFVSEACSPILVKVGDKVTKDTQLCSILADSIETGWAQDGTTQLPIVDSALYETHHGCKTAYGLNFNQLMLKLGAMGGYTHVSKQCTDNGGTNETVLGELAPGWPTW